MKICTIFHIVCSGGLNECYQLLLLLLCNTEILIPKINVFNEKCLFFLFLAPLAALAAIAGSQLRTGNNKHRKIIT